MTVTLKVAVIIHTTAMKKINTFLLSLLIVTLAASNTVGVAFAVSNSPAQIAELIRSSLVQAQLDLTNDPAHSAQLVQDAETAYQTGLSNWFVDSAPDAHLRILSAFDLLNQSLETGDVVAFSSARAQVWTGILAGSYTITEASIQNGDGTSAQTWLSVREFRTATRFSRPNADATRAVNGFIKGEVTAEDTLLSIRADLLDTYQARLNESVRDLAAADANGFNSRRAELASLAEGYFFILAPAYAEQRGTDAAVNAQTAFSELHNTAIENPAELGLKLTAIQTVLENFRAAPLSPAEQSRRAGQVLRFLSLVPVEYTRGVTDGRVTKDLEIQEATTFHEGAYAAFTDLKDLLDAQNHEQTLKAEALFQTMGQQLEDAGTHKAVVSAEEMQSQTDELTEVLKATIPAEWLKQSSQGDFDVISSMLDQMQVAVRNGEYDLAESARLEAYAMLEMGPEAKLIVFAPELKLQIEELFWNGQGEHKGLSYLIKNNASYSEVKASRLELDASLKEAQTILGKNTAPAAIATNAGIIVFREGLEAVVIIASLMSSLKSAEERKYRRPMWAGVILALVVTALTWVLAHGILQSLARYGEKLEAVVSVIAIAVLLLIMNWFFHNTYWTGWLASFHAQKKRLLTGEAGLFLGLVTLGFTSVYREGFEIVLFLQALVLEGGVGTVLVGVLVALLGVYIIGLIIFRLQKSLPYMKILVITGVMIGAVLLQMVGSTIHIMQVVGWMPIHVVEGASFSYWLGTWFGVYPTWEGLGFQLASLIFVFGSYYLAEGLRKKKVFSPKKQMVKSNAET